MNGGNRVVKGTRATLDAEVRDRLRHTAVATISAELRRRGYPDMSIDGVHSRLPGSKLVGPARTLRFVAYRPDLSHEYGSGYHAQKQAFDDLRAGDVLVIEARRDPSTGTFGDVLALRAKVLGAAGIVSDGGVRDSAAVAGIGLPTFTQSVHPAVLGRRHVPWETDTTITCGGVAVQPGDIVVGDDDGVVVIPAHLVEEVADAAADQEKQDAWVAQRIAEGNAVEGLFPPTGRWKEEFDRWRESH
ncbi:RraA family protein [Streptomyces griseoruber]